MKTSIAITVFVLMSIIGITFSYSQENIRKIPAVNKLTDSVALAYQYDFKDSLGKTVHLSDFKGKLVMVDIWYSGCGACVQCNNGITEVHKLLKNKKDLIFMSISVDVAYDIWLNSITKGAKATQKALWPGRYTPFPGTITVNTGGNGENNIFIKKYVPAHAYPQLLLFDKSGKLISSNPPRPDYNPTELANYILKYLN